MPIPTTRDFSVKFGRGHDLGLEGQKAFPFIYTFVNHNDDTWTANAAPLSLANLGPTIPANSRKDINVRLDQDYNFKLLAIKYSVYWSSYEPPNGGPGSTTFSWYENGPAATPVDGLDPGMMLVGTPLTRYIAITLSVQGSGSQTIYGGVDPGPLKGYRVPVPLTCIEGYDYGFYTVRTPRLLPMQGIMAFEVTNSHPRKDLVVAAAIYGMKVRI